MTMLTNAFSQYDAVGIREDLADVIYNISPTETPFVTAAGKRKVTQKLYEWQTDALAAAVTTNAHLEGDAEAASAVTPTVRLANFAQIFKKAFTVTGSEEVARKAGRKSEIAYQLAKHGKELKRDFEATLTSSQVGVGGGTTTARKTAGFDSWLKTNTNNGNGTTGDYEYTSTPVTARTAATAGNIRTFTETILKEIIAKQWKAGGETKMLMVGPFNKAVVSGFAGIADIRFNAKGNKQASIIGAADIYVSDFGNVEVVPNRFMPENRAYLIDPEYIAIGSFRPFHSEQLAKTGDGETHVIRLEAGLVVNNEAAHAVARDLTVS